MERLISLALGGLFAASILACSAPAPSALDECEDAVCDEEDETTSRKKKSSDDEEDDDGKKSNGLEPAQSSKKDDQPAKPADPPAPAEKTPPEICSEMADVVGDAAARCGQSRLENRTAFIDAAAGGDCGNITSVRDQSSLFDTCIPWFQTAACSQLTDSQAIPEECRGQLRR